MFRQISLLTVLLLSLGTGIALADVPNNNSAAPNAIAQRRGPGPGRGPGGIFQQINLSEAQQQELQSIQESYRPRMQQVQQQLRQEQQGLNQMISGTASESELRRQYQQVASLRNQLGELRFQSILEMRGVMSAEQRQELNELIENQREAMRERMRDRMGN
ncbi:MAG: Spy/CpxP family protein refolding chaperone [Cyanobacteriota bacterium]